MDVYFSKILIKIVNNVCVKILPQIQIQQTNNLKTDIEPYEVLKESVKGKFILNHNKIHNKVYDNIRTILVDILICYIVTNKNTYVCKFG